MIQQAFGDQILSRAQVFKWHARFKTGLTSIDDDEHAGRPRSCTTPETVERIKQLVRQDRRRTIHDIAEEVGIGYGTCQRVLTEEMGVHRVAAKFVPRTLRADQKQQRVTFCTELRQLASDNETLSRVITGDESWIYGYDSETKQQSYQWKAPRHQGQKKPDRWKSMSTAWLLLSLTSRGLCTKNFSQHAKLWIPSSTAKFCGVCVKTCEDFGENRPGCFAMTTPLLTLSSSPSSFWPKTKWLSSPTHHTPLIWHPVISSYFQKLNWRWKDAGLIPLRRYRPNRRECLTLW